MHVLVILAHPETSSLNARLAAEVMGGIEESGHSAEIADLAREGFDPRILPADLSFYRGAGPLPGDVSREQQRVEQADALVLVFPVYWWSMPSLLKGWIDRVFTQGWAFGSDERGKIIGLLRDRPVHILATASGSPGSYERHGYRQAIATQIDHGIFAFCGIGKATTHLLFGVEDGDAAVNAAHLKEARRIGATLFTRQNSGSPETLGPALP